MSREKHNKAPARSEEHKSPIDFLPFQGNILSILKNSLPEKLGERP